MNLIENYETRITKIFDRRQSFGWFQKSAIATRFQSRVAIATKS